MVSIHFGRIAVMAALLIVQAASDPDAPEESDDDKKMKIGVKHANKHLQEEMKWRDGDIIEAQYAEFLLAAWVLDHAPWNAYHSGMAFRNTRTGGKALLDFTPDDTSSVMKMVLPAVNIDNLVKAALLGDVSFDWHAGAHMEFYGNWPDHFTTFTKVGTFNATVMYKLIDWVNVYFVPKYRAFNPVEVVSPPDSSKKGSTVLRSRMCHDFVTDALWVLYDNGAALKADGTIFRDHILMYAEDIQKVDALEESRVGRRAELRYLRGLFLYLDKIKQQFTYAREALITIYRVGLPVFVHDENGDYHKVKLIPPFLNYCYLPLAIPPNVYSPFGDQKLCALGMEANVSNVTTPSSMAYVIAAEENLDQPPVLIALFVMAILVAYLAASSESNEKVDKTD